MESSLVIKLEYFELVKKFNQANKLKNQETDVYFYIDSTNPDYLKLFATISDFQKILLCYKINRSKWVESQFSEFPNLEIFIAQLLRYKKSTTDLTKQIKSHIFKLAN